jgi:adenine deaminase
MDFDIILKNGNVIDVENKCYLLADIGVKGNKIAYIGNLDNRNARNIVDCRGKFLSPSFIDAHVHIESSMATPAEFAKAVVKHGTAAVIADPHELVNVGGTAALREFLEMNEAACIDVFTVVPSSVPATPFDTNGAGEVLAEDMKPFVDRSDVVGLGEVMCYNEVLKRDKKIMDKIALFKNKTIDGHSAGLSKADELRAYAAAGIDNDHECITFEDAKAVYDAGMNVYIREGSAARSLEAIVKGIVRYNAAARQDGGKTLDMSRFAFCTDDKHLSTIEKEGHIDFCVKKAVALGLSLIDAVSFASLNPAKFYRLGERGALAVGRIADIVVFSDKTASRVELVVRNGKIADDKYISTLKGAVVSNKPSVLKNSVKCRHFGPEDFQVEIQPFNNAIKLHKNQVLTDLEVLSRTEAAQANMLVTVERYGKNGNVAKCFLKGYGIRGGAVATSVAHDSHNIVAAGDNAADMAAAVNRLKEIGGGYVIAANGEIVGELNLDLGGLISSAGAKEIRDKIDELEKIARAMGVEEGIDPFLTLSFVALPVIPCVRLLDTGLFDVLNTAFIK